MPGLHLMKSPLRPLLALLVLFAAAARATTGVNLQMQLGNPSKATTDTANQRNFLIQRAQYAIDYNATTREPNWVSWNLTTTDVGSSGRGDFEVDPTLPSGFYRVLTTDYSGSGYDRGHLCPSGDRTANVDDNQITFYMSNMVPQAPDNNQGVWASFETYCRSLASIGNEILIIDGPGGFAGANLASGVAIPGYVWKIVIVVPLGPGSALSRITTTTRVIALKIPNIAGIRSNPWQQYTTSIAQLETDTGYTFLTDLPAATATALRARVDDQSTTGAPRITTSPVAQVASLGGTATFSVSAAGNPPLAYQWALEGEDITGATAATLTLANIQVAGLGNYSVLIANSFGSVTSATAALTLGAADSGVLFWDFSGQTPTNGLPPDLTGGTVTQGSNNGTTQLLTTVSVSSGYAGATGSSNAGAAARVGPLNRTPGSGSAYFEFTLGTPAGRQLVVSSFTFGTRSTATGPQAFALFTSADDFTTPLAAGPIANNSVWTLLAPTFPAIAGVPGSALTFRLYGYNGAGNAGVSTANWRIDDLKVGVSVVANSAAPPVITRQPGNITVVAGRTTTLSVAATGSPAPTYQWRKDGIAIPGATNPTLTLANVAAAQAGNYSVSLGNSAATVTSAVSTLNVIRRSYAGTYFGPLPENGAFALLIAEDNTGVALGYEVIPPFLDDLPAGGTLGGNRTYVGRTVAVDDNGRFRFVAASVSTSFGSVGGAAGIGLPPTPNPRISALGQVTIAGGIDELGGLTGTATGSAIFTLNATKLPATGGAAAVAGFYQAGAPGSSAQVLAIVSATGQAIVLASTPTGMIAGNGPTDTAGKLTLRTTGAQSLTATLSAATGALSATLADAGTGATTSFTGFAVNSAAAAAQRLVNLSARATAASEEQAAIVGFVITGLESKSVLVRAVGPGLRNFGVPAALTAPNLELRRGSTPVATNAGWSSAPNATEIAGAAARSGAFPLGAGATDSAIFTTLAPGAYTAVISAADGRAGVALVEVYDLSSGSAAQRLANLSARALTGSGDNTLIAGLVVGGTAPKRVLVRAAGPALAAFGVSGVLARPVLTLFAGATTFATNSGWSTAPDAPAIAEATAQTGAFAFGATSLDAALVINLAPGTYTAQVNGLGGTAGIVLLEIYELP